MICLVAWLQDFLLANYGACYISDFVFCFKVYFLNLQPVELSAMIYAAEFFGKSAGYFYYFLLCYRL